MILETHDNEGQEAGLHWSNLMICCHWLYRNRSTINMADALFKQYETDYCSKSTELDKKIGLIPSLIGGEYNSYIILC